MLLTSELVTNAVLHAPCTPLEVGITLAAESVLVTVHDLDLARPEQQPYYHREGGWGLGLVDALARTAPWCPTRPAARPPGSGCRAAPPVPSTTGLPPATAGTADRDAAG